MGLVQNFRSFRSVLRQAWDRMADSAFGERDDMARGEFISAFISERGLSFPTTPPAERPRR